MKTKENYMPITALKVSVSGIRAVIGDTLTPQLILEFTQAFGTYLKPGARVVLGRDSRVSGPMVRRVVIGGLLASGCEVIDIGLVPIPTTHIMVKKLKADGGVCITASHNPVEWNALKFINSEAIVLPVASAKEVVDLYHSGDFVTVAPDKIKSISMNNSAVETHIAEVMKHVDINGIKQKKFKVVIDYCNGSGAVISGQLLREMGCKVVEINKVPDGIFPHHPEPLTVNLGQLMEVVKKEKADIGFAQDADADRLGIVDENGFFIGEEMTLALSALYALPEYRTPLVTNLSSSSILDYVAARSKVKIYRSKVGEANVVELMKKVNSKIGGEGGGKLIFSPVTMSADSISAIAMVMALLTREGKPLSKITAEFPALYQIKNKIDIGKNNVYSILRAIKDEYAKETLNLEDGIKILRKDGWIHIRPSNTEPIIRYIVETSSEKKTKDIVAEIVKVINKIMK